MKKLLIIFTSCIAPLSATGQQILTLDEMVAQALRNNKSIHAAELEVAYQEKRRRFASDIGQTNVVLTRGQINSYVENDYNLSISQNIPFPIAIHAQFDLGKEMIEGARLQKVVLENVLVHQVKKSFFNLMFLRAKEALLKQEDTLYGDFLKSAELRYSTGKSRLLEKATAETEWNEVQNRLSMTEGYIVAERTLLHTLLNSEEDIITREQQLFERKLILDSGITVVNQNPDLAYLKQQVEIAERDRRVARSNTIPGINIGFFSQSLIGSPLTDPGNYATNSHRFNGFQVGLNIPIWFWPQVARVKAAEVFKKHSQSRYEYNEDMLAGEWERSVQNYLIARGSLDYYQSSALDNASLVLNESQTAYRNGEIEYPEYWISIQYVMRIREKYLSALNDVNQSVVYLEYLIGARN